MTLTAAEPVRALDALPAASLVEWAAFVNGLAAKAAGAHDVKKSFRRAPGAPAKPAVLLTTGAEQGAGAGAPGPAGEASFGYRMRPDVAERLVAQGLEPGFLADIAAFSGLEPRDVLDFVGIDRTTVSRRKAAGATLPQEASVKALQLADLLTQATEVFGAPRLASTWLARPHPLLEGETPLKRARTPWGLGKVQAMLVALRFGGAA